MARVLGVGSAIHETGCRVVTIGEWSGKNGSGLCPSGVDVCVLEGACWQQA
ncbi:MAG: hypothetical protein NTU41_02140 [Chloroflexi bacterium]|nr:hypothetical protein [Chloroflexota bacterium]